MAFDLKKEAQNALALADTLDMQAHVGGPRALVIAAQEAAGAARDLAKSLALLSHAVDRAAPVKKKK